MTLPPSGTRTDGAETPAEPPAETDRDGSPDSEDPKRKPDGTGLSRRGLIALFGGVAAAGVGVAATGAVIARNGGAGAQQGYDFHGTPHQAGIVTEVQDQMHFAAFDVREGTTRDELIELMSDWTYAASRLTQGLDVSATGSFDGGEYMPPDDSGEAVGIAPAGLTLTFGFGRSLFETEQGEDRFGIAARMPANFSEIPTMTNDFLQPERSGGDLCIQACANDPQVAVHAIRNLTRIAVGRAVLRWSQLGFGRSSSTTSDQETPRNLFGQKDGTANLHADQSDELDTHVWIGKDAGAAWAAGGSYLVARRIAMTIEVWDTLQLGEQERVTGRDKREGAPLSGGTEFTEPDFGATDDAGNPRIDERSHLFRVHPDQNEGIKMLRRSYNYVDGNDAQGRLDAGLFFIAFVNDPARFSKVHKNMSRDDMFVEYLKTTSSSVFLVPPGVSEGQYIGQQLLGA